MSAEDYYAQGLRYLELGDDQAALLEFQKTIEVDPTFFLAYYEIGKIHIKDGSSRDAIDAFTAAIAIKPDFFPSYYHRGRSLASLKSDEKAIEDFTVFIKANPDHALAHLCRGRVYLRTIFKENAKSDFFQFVFLACEEELKPVLTEVLHFFSKKASAPFMIGNLIKKMMFADEAYNWEGLLFDFTDKWHNFLLVRFLEELKTIQGKEEKLMYKQFLLFSAYYGGFPGQGLIEPPENLMEYYYQLLCEQVLGRISILNAAKNQAFGYFRQYRFPNKLSKTELYYGGKILLIYAKTLDVVSEKYEWLKRANQMFELSAQDDFLPANYGLLEVALEAQVPTLVEVEIINTIRKREMEVEPHRRLSAGFKPRFSGGEMSKLMPVINHYVYVKENEKLIRHVRKAGDPNLNLPKFWEALRFPNELKGAIGHLFKAERKQHSKEELDEFITQNPIIRYEVSKTSFFPWLKSPKVEEKRFEVKEVVNIIDQIKGKDEMESGLGETFQQLHLSKLQCSHYLSTILLQYAYFSNKLSFYSTMFLYGYIKYVLNKNKLQASDEKLYPRSRLWFFKDLLTSLFLSNNRTYAEACIGMDQLLADVSKKEAYQNYDEVDYSLYQQEVFRFINKKLKALGEVNFNRKYPINIARFKKWRFDDSTDWAIDKLLD